MCRYFVLFVFILLSILNMLFANMASPYLRGSEHPSIGFTTDMDVREELLNITLDSYETGTFDVRYTIYSPSDFQKVLISFDFGTHSISDVQNFSIKLDGQTVTLEDLSAYVEELPKDFEYLESVKKALDEQHANLFELNISKGEHVIEVHYSAVAITYLNSYKHFLYNYNLEPIKYWKSFGQLHINLDFSKLPKGTVIKVNNEEYGIDKYQLSFDSLDINSLDIYVQPVITTSAKIAVTIGQIGFGLMAFTILAILHIYAMLQYRKKVKAKGFSSVWLVGVIIIALLSWAITLYSGLFIDWLLDDFASGRSDVIYMLVFGFPVLILFYLILTFGIDLMFKKRLAKINNKGL